MQGSGPTVGLAEAPILVVVRATAFPPISKSTLNRRETLKGKLGCRNIINSRIWEDKEGLAFGNGARRCKEHNFIQDD